MATTEQGQSLTCSSSRTKARANRVAEKMVSGNSWINAHNVFAYGLPYGGVNLSGFVSGFSTKTASGLLQVSPSTCTAAGGGVSRLIMAEHPPSLHHE